MVQKENQPCCFTSLSPCTCWPVCVDHMIHYYKLNRGVMNAKCLLSGELEWIIMIDTSTQAGSSLLPDRLTQLTKIAGLLLAKTSPIGWLQTGSATTSMSLNISLLLMRSYIWLLGKLRSNFTDSSRFNILGNLFIHFLTGTTLISVL